MGGDGRNRLVDVWWWFFSGDVFSFHGPKRFERIGFVCVEGNWKEIEEKEKKIKYETRKWLCCWSKVPDVTRSIRDFVTTCEEEKCADSFLLILFYLNFLFLFLFFWMWFFQVLKRRKSWVRCYFPATRSGRVWREIGTDWFTANTPSKPSTATLAASIWPPILDRLWSSGWTLSAWRPSYKIPRACPSREFDVSNGFSYQPHPSQKLSNFTSPFFSLDRSELNKSQLDVSSGSAALNGSRRSSKAVVAENKAQGVDASFDSTAPDQPTGASLFSWCHCSVFFFFYSHPTVFSKKKKGKNIYINTSSRIVR